MQRLGQSADLVDLDENRVRDSLADALLEALDVGDEEVVADELDLAAEAIRQQLPPHPVVLGHAVLDADDRIAADPRLVHVDELGRRQGLALAFELVGAVGVELAGGGVEGDRHIVAGPVARDADRLDDELQRVLVGREAGREAALVADAGGQLPFLEHRLQRVIHLGRCAQSLAV